MFDLIPCLIHEISYSSNLNHMNSKAFSTQDPLERHFTCH